MYYTSPHQEELLVWPASLDENFTVASCYSWLQEQGACPLPLVSWSWIWSVKVPEKVRIFALQALHGALPVGVVLGHRGVSQAVQCLVCGASPESQLHCLRDCGDALNVWNNLALSLAPDFFSETSMEGWINSVSRSEVVSLLVHALCIWYRRCRLIFGQDREP